MLVAGVTLVAAGLGRQVSALKILETSRVSHHLADRLLTREILFHDRDVERSIPEVEGFHSSVWSEPLRVPRSPLPALEMERVLAEVSWELRGKSRSVRLEAGWPKGTEQSQ